MILLKTIGGVSASTGKKGLWLQVGWFVRLKTNKNLTANNNDGYGYALAA